MQRHQQGVLPCLREQHTTESDVQLQRGRHFRVVQEERVQSEPQGKSGRLAITDQYNIPRPKGGQRNQDLILAEDQIDLPGIKSKIMKREKYMKDQFNKADHAYECGFGFDDIKKSNKHFPSYQAGYGRKNPNDNEFWKKRGGRK